MLVYVLDAFRGAVVGDTPNYSSPDLYRSLADAEDIAVAIKTTNATTGGGCTITVLAQSAEDGVAWQGIVVTSFLLVDGTIQFQMASLEDAFRGPFGRMAITLSKAAASVNVELIVAGRSQHRRALQPGIVPLVDASKSIGVRAELPPSIASGKPLDIGIVAPGMSLGPKGPVPSLPTDLLPWTGTMIEPTRLRPRIFRAQDAMPFAPGSPVLGFTRLRTLTPTDDPRCPTTTYYVTARGSPMPRPGDRDSPYSSLPGALAASAASGDCRTRIVLMGSVPRDLRERRAEITRPTEIVVDTTRGPTLASIADPIVNTGGHDLLVDGVHIVASAAVSLYQVGGRLTVRRVNVRNSGGQGIAVWGRAYTVMEETHVEWCAREGILINGRDPITRLDTPAWFAASNLVLNNNCQSLARGEPAGSLAIVNGVGAMITTCQVYETPWADSTPYGYGIWIDRAGAFMQHLTAGGNGCGLGARDAGLYLENVVLRDGSTGLQLTRVRPLTLWAVSVFGNAVGIGYDASTSEAVLLWRGETSLPDQPAITGGLDVRDNTSQTSTDSLEFPRVADTLPDY